MVDNRRHEDLLERVVRAGAPMRLAHALSWLVLAAIIAIVGTLCSTVELHTPRNESTIIAASFRTLAQPTDHAIAQAQALGHLWLNTARWRAAAERAFAGGRSRAALGLLERAFTEARLAVNQARVERARYWLTRDSANPRDRILVGALRARVAARDGSGAMTLLQRLNPSR
jgi:hypothetical protein